MAKFYVDADVGRRAVVLLQELGHEVEYCIDSDLGDRSDAFHLKRSADNDMILVTMNSQDYRSLHRLWKALAEWGIMAFQHAGIVTVSRQLEASDLVIPIRSLLEREGDLTGKLFTWDVQYGEWHPDRF
ncbi:MAG: DUF5615 family PIN-like protein [Dehalococcoidia bacterium]|nr:DUF5615 family PIN-like protein [Dehalococcoidia bacterium]